MMALVYLVCAIATAILGVVADRFIAHRHAEWRERHGLDSLRLENCIDCGEFREHGHECDNERTET